MSTGRLASRLLTQKARARGFTYIGLLIAIVVTGIGLAVAGPVSHTLQMRDKERELLFVGDQFRRAIAMYYEQSPGGLKQYPKKLEELLRDNRYPNVQRYLRKLYVDPLTGKKEWGLVEQPGIGILGVYSLSDQSPVKTANFPTAYQSFRAAKKHSDWKFVYLPGQSAAQPASTPPAMQSPLPPATQSPLTPAR
jgi:type II secretory pathway pseudopilin PulG